MRRKSLLGLSLVVLLGMAAGAFAQTTPTPTAPTMATPTRTATSMAMSTPTRTVTPTGGMTTPTRTPTGGMTVTVTATPIVTPMVTATPGTGGAPTSADQCKDGGWRTFTNPRFKNQGDCVSFVASQGRAGGNPRATPTP